MSTRGIQFDINDELCLKDPQMSEYGQRLLSNSVYLFDELGFEKFTFKKLAIKIDSTEASIYRYFENKHKLLLWLINWYWDWVYYLIDINTLNINDPQKKLFVVVHNIVNASTESPLTSYINENILHQVVIKEGSKAYHVPEVDNENEHGYYQTYKDLVEKVAQLILEVNADFPYPRILASNLFEMANNQIYFAEHLPSLTDIKNGKESYKQLEEAMCYMIKKLV